MPVKKNVRKAQLKPDSEASQRIARIERVRERSGIRNYSEFARALGIRSRSITSELEAGKRPSQEMYVRLGNFAAEHKFNSDALWFFKKAGIDPRAIFAAGREALEESAVPASKTRMRRLPIMRKAAAGFEETGLSVSLPSALVTDATMCFAAEKARVRYGFAAGQIIVLDTSLNEREMSKTPMAVVIEFRPRQSYEGLGDSEKSVREWEDRSQGLFLGEVRVNPGQPRTLHPMKWEVEFSRLTDDPSVTRMPQSPPPQIALGSGMQHEREAGTAKVELDPRVRLIGKVIAVLPQDVAEPSEPR